MKSTTLMVAVVVTGVMVTTLEVAARHRGYHSVGGAVGNAQSSKPSVNPGNAANDKGAGDAPEKPANDTSNGTKSAPNRIGDNPPVGQGTDAPLDLSITVFRGRGGQNLHPTSKNAHDPKGGLTGKPNLLPPPAIATVPGIVHGPHYVVHQPKLPAGPKSTPSRNAIGAIIDHGKAGDHRGALASPGAPMTRPPAGSSPGPGASGGNGEGKPVIANAPINATNPAGVDERHTLHPATSEPGVPTAPIIGIGGTATIHPQSRTGAIGGPVKIVSGGGLNGTGFRTRHP